MNKDINKFSLVAYEKGNISNRKILIYTGKLKVESGKSKLSMIDNYTSRFSYDELYKQLLEKGIITKEQTKFVIWYKDGNIIKQIPVIYEDDIIRDYTTYMNLDENKIKEEWTNEFRRLNNKYSESFISKLDTDSRDYDKDEKQEHFMENDSFSSRFIRMPFVKKELKNSVVNRIKGTKISYKDEESQLSKNCENYRKNYWHIKKNIESSYRCFRDVYIYLKNGENYEKTHKDLSYDDIFNNTNKETKKIYNILEFFDLLESRNYGNALNEYMCGIEVLSKTIRNKINRYQKSMDRFGDDYDIIMSDIIIYNNKHDNIIVNLLNEYMNQKKITKK